MRTKCKLEIKINLTDYIFDLMTSVNFYQELSLYFFNFANFRFLNCLNFMIKIFYDKQNNFMNIILHKKNMKSVLCYNFHSELVINFLRENI